MRSIQARRPPFGILVIFWLNYAADGLGVRRAASLRRRGAVDVYRVAGLLDEMKVAAESHQVSTLARYRSEMAMLRKAMWAAWSSADRAKLEATVQHLEESRMEAENADNEILTFYYSMKAALGGRGAAPNCQFLICGKDGECVEHPEGGAKCQCRRCYEGDGFTCSRTACPVDTSRYPAALLPGGPGPPGKHQGARELDAVVFSPDRVALVFRAEGQEDRGFLVLGRVAGGSVEFGGWQGFSGEAKAFGPRVAALPTGRLVLAFRDEDRGGAGYIVGGEVAGPKGLAARLGAPEVFAKYQSQRAVLVPLATSRVACLYADREIEVSEGKKTVHAFGRSMLVQVLEHGQMSLLGRYDFADMPVARLASTALTPTSFIVGYRGMPADAAAGAPSRELSTVWVEMVGEELVVDAHPLFLEPGRAQMWARDLSLVSQNLVAYSYYSGSERATKTAVLRVDPESREISVASEPRVVGKGLVRYLHSLSVPPSSTAAHSFMYSQRPGKNGVLQTCQVAPSGAVGRCQNKVWADYETDSAAGGRLHDGKFLFLFTNKIGDPHYQLLNPTHGSIAE